MQDDPRNATLVERRDASEHVAILRVRPDRDELPRFEPGQFAVLGLPKPAEVEVRASTDAVATRSLARPRLVRRPYSIASAASERRHLEFCVVKVPAGRLTEPLWELGEGARLWLDEEIRGGFTLELAPRGASLLLVATGTGVAPFVSMLRTYHGSGRWRRCALVHGVRFVGDLVYRDELFELARRDPSVSYLPIVSREPEASDWKGLRGRVQLALASAELEPWLGARGERAPDDVHAFLCGNPAMIHSVAGELGERGFRLPTRGEPGNLHFERYW